MFFTRRQRRMHRRTSARTSAVRRLRLRPTGPNSSDGGVAQSSDLGFPGHGRTTRTRSRDWGSRGPRFKSRQPDHESAGQVQGSVPVPDLRKSRPSAIPVRMGRPQYFNTAAANEARSSTAYNAVPEHSISSAFRDFGLVPIQMERSAPTAACYTSRAWGEASPAVMRNPYGWAASISRTRDETSICEMVVTIEMCR